MLVACGKMSTNEFAESVERITPSFSIKGVKAFVIIPSDGCASCTSRVKRLLEANLQEVDSVMILFIRIRDRKQFKQDLSTWVLPDSMRLIDWDNAFKYNVVSTDFPWLVLVEDGEITKQVELEKPDSAWVKLLPKKHKL